MSKLIIFNFISLNGYYKGQNGDTSWHQHGEEEGNYSLEMLNKDNILLFGRVTYEMMVGFWSTQEAVKSMPAVASGMNRSEKIVFSRTLHKADWNNTRIIKENIGEEVRKLKKTSGKDLAVLGSGSIVSQLTEQGLVDEYQLMVDPVILGGGTPIFKEVGHKLELKHVSTRTFKSGNVLLTYRNG